MLFSSVIGQEKLKQDLIRIIRSKRVAHAQLFAGKIGYGTLPMALAYAQYLLCEAPGQTDACGQCKACVKNQKLAHPDVHFSYPFNTTDSKKGKVNSLDFIDEWRRQVVEDPYFSLEEWQQTIQVDNKQTHINVYESEQIVKRLSLKPFEAKNKVLIMWEAHLMNAMAANKLLKWIEEPTDNTVLLLLSSDPEKLLTTILSRTQRLQFPALRGEVITTALQQQYDLSAEQAVLIAGQVNGDWLEARQAVNRSEEYEEFFRLFTHWMRAAYEVNIEKIYQWVTDISSCKREKQKRFLEYSLLLMRQALLHNYQPDHTNLFGEEVHHFLQKFGPFIRAENIIQIDQLLNDAHYQISRNAYSKILFMDVSMKFANLLRVKKRSFVN
jgi:DNA polymerase-3 subunit delta'